MVTTPASYNVLARDPNQGTAGDTATYRADIPATYNKPAEFTNLCANAYTGTTTRTALGDTDNDGICDTWEPASGTAGGVTCPERATVGSFIDSVAGDSVVDCNVSTVSLPLCITDAYSDVWGNKVPNSLICPRKDHKDMFVEMDYFAGYQPSKEAIKDVIMAFGNAPITNAAADDFGRTKGITLHFVLDESLPGTGQIAAWSDTNGVAGDDFDSIKLGCPTCSPTVAGHFGKLSEHGTTYPLPTTDTARKIDMKHYVYRYGIGAKSWGSPPSACSPSGIAEVLGNDFIVSLGCGFGSFGGSAGTAPRTSRNIDARARTYIRSGSWRASL